MSRFTLRYEFLDVPLLEGQLVAGRATDCDLVMDDAAVSRRHARFAVDGASVTVEDLGSRNGVFVNGTRIEEPIRLRHGDRIRVGTKELSLHDMTRQQRHRNVGTTKLVRCDVCGTLKPPEEDCAQCGTSGTTDAEPTLTCAPVEATTAVMVQRSTPRESMGTFQTLTRLSDRALEMGRAAEAERLLSGALHKLLARAEAHQDEVSGAEAEVAARYALKLAQATGNPRWADYPLDLYAALDALMPQAVVEQLYEVAGPIRYGNPAALKRYVGQLRERERLLGPNDRFILSRLHGLARMLASR